MIENSRYYFNLDTEGPIPVNPGEFYIDGWFHPRSVRLEEVDIKLIVDGIDLPIRERYPRPDVAKALSITGSDRSGFLIRFHRPKFDPQVKLTASVQAEEFILTELTIETSSRRARKDVRREIRNYRDWLVHCEESLFWDEREISEKIEGFAQKPLFSIVLPTFNSDLALLNACLESVRKQHYANWQLCITDDGSYDAGVIQYLKEAAGSDERIVFRQSPARGGISSASNRSLESARGDYVVLLDHDDELHPFALLELARYLNEFPDTPLVYSDEDKMDTYCRRSQPAFKPDFDFHMFRAFNYLGHLVAVQRDVALKIGGFRPKSDGAQDWDFLMRAIEVVGSKSVGHIRKPLYHWRMHQDSTSMDLLSKPYVRKAWMRVLSEHLDRVEEQAAIEPGISFGTMRVKYKLPKDLRVGVFIRLEDGEYQRALVERTLDSRIGKVYQVSDCAIRRLPGSDEATAADLSLASLGDIEEDVLIFISRPLEMLSHSFFEELARHAVRPECGIVTGISLDPERRVAHSGHVGTAADELKDPFIGLKLSEHSYMNQIRVARRVETISEFFFATERRHVAAAGGIACISSTRMREFTSKLVQHAACAGLQVVFTPYAVAIFEDNFSDPLSPSTRQRGGSGFPLNPNLEMFADFRSVARGIF